MAGEQIAPDQQALDAATPPPAGSPTPDQPAAAAAPPPTQSRPPVEVDVPALQRGFTQATQQNAAIKAALGLPKDADISTVTEAISALKAKGTSKPAADEDPRIAQMRADLVETKWRANERIYGPLATQARSFMEAAQSDDPDEMMAVFYTAITESARTGTAQSAPAATTPEVQAPAAAATPPPVPDLVEAPLGSQGLRQVDNLVPAAEVGSGSFRGLAERLFGAR